MSHDLELDARGWNCPLPVLRAKQSIDKLNSGQVLHVIASDKGSTKNFTSFCNETGNELIESTVTDGVYTFTIRKN